MSKERHEHETGNKKLTCLIHACFLQDLSLDSEDTNGMFLSSVRSVSTVCSML
jgi:hypothetical protein